MAILDGQLTLTSVASGDSPTTQTDNACTHVLDTGVNGLFFTGIGGAYVAPFLIARVTTAFTTSASGTIQIVLQDAKVTSSSDATPTDWADLLLGEAAAAATAVDNYVLFAQRIPQSHRRFLRVIARIGTGAMTAGTYQAFITLDRDVIDLAMRQASATFSQSGQNSMAVGNSVLDS